MLLEALAESETLGCGLYHLSIRLGLNPQMEASFIAGRNGGRNCSAVLILALGSICSLKRCSQAIIYFSFFSSSFLPTRKYWETWPQVFSYLPEVKSLVNKNSMHICHVQLLLDKWEGINLSKLKWNLRITARLKSATRKSLQLISLSSFLSFFFSFERGSKARYQVCLSSLLKGGLICHKRHIFDILRNTSSSLFFLSSQGGVKVRGWVNPGDVYMWGHQGVWRNTLFFFWRNLVFLND